MADKKYAQGIYIKKKMGKYGEYLNVSIKTEDGYKNYNFFPKKEQKDDSYVEYYGLVIEKQEGDN